MKLPTALVLLGLALCAYEPLAAQSMPTLDSRLSWERHCLWGIEVMSASHGLSELQVTSLRHYLDEEESMIDLFANYGLLDEDALQAKAREIFDVTQEKIRLALTPAQVDCWNDWMARYQRRKSIRRVNPPSHSGS